MSTTQQDLLKLQNASEEQNTSNQQSSQLIERHLHPNSAFQIVGNKEQGYFVALGMYRITAQHTKEDCAKMIEQRDYELILGLIGASIEQTIKDHKQFNDLLNNK